MSAMGPKLRRVEGGKVAFWCPACDRGHFLTMRSATGDGWGYDDNEDVPTFTPSVLARHRHHVPPVTPENIAEWRRAPWVQTEVEDICHLYVTNGRILYLGDCTHDMAGKTVDLPDWPGWRGIP